jgi:glycosyltransferase involved in cell wall biosynthesis
MRKLLIVNRSYYVSGGPERYLFGLAEHMDGYDVIPFSVGFKENISTPYSRYFLPAPESGVYYRDFKLADKLRFAFASIYNFAARNLLERLIVEQKPNVAYFLNAVYFSDSIVDACKRHGIPIVWRISDFHKVCASYLLLRDGQVCEQCLNHGLFPAIWHGCGGYQRSHVAALIKVSAMLLSRIRRVYKHVDFFVTPTEFTRDIMIRGGFDPARVVTIPTFVADAYLCKDAISAPPEIPTIGYVGRLSQEKGVHVLLEAFNRLGSRDCQLVIVGDDTTPYAEHLKRSVPEDRRQRVRFLGFQNEQAIRDLIKSCSFLVVPSMWYENLPNALLESMAMGRANVVSDLGSLPDTVRHMETGLLFRPGDSADLAEKLTQLVRDSQLCRSLGAAARSEVQRKYTVQMHMTKLMCLFDKVLEGR